MVAFGTVPIDTAEWLMSGSQGDLRQQIGETLATVRALEKALDGVVRDVSATKHEMRNAQTATQGRQEIVANEFMLLKQRVGAMEEQLKELREPVDELVSLRKRLGALGLLVLSLITVLWALAAPLWTLLVNKLAHWFAIAT